MRKKKDPTRKSLSDFKELHDPHSVIAKLEAELKKAQQESADSAAIKEVLGTLALDLNKLDPPAWTYEASETVSSVGVPTLFLSDFHWGEVVHPSQINGVNAFNMTIANKRLRYTVETAIKLLRIVDQDLGYPGIVVPLGGDMVSGNIHEELQVTNELNIMPVVLDLYDGLVGVIKLLADTFGSVFLPCVSGNHGRDTMKTWAKDRHHTSFDWLLYQFLGKHFVDDDRVVFYIPDGSDAQYKIFKTRYNLTHGDQFRGGDSIIGPIGPLTRGNQKKLARNQAVDQGYDIMICGHFHQYIHLRRLIVNGSIKGYDEYAAAKNYGFEEPMQALWLTHPRYGITFRMPCYSEQAKKGKAEPWISHFPEVESGDLARTGAG